MCNNAPPRTVTPMSPAYSSTTRPLSLSCSYSGDFTNLCRALNPSSKSSRLGRRGPMECPIR